MQLTGVPLKFRIQRARAEILSGDGATVALSIREKPSPTGVLDIPLEYSLTTSPLDSGEDIFVKARHADPRKARGEILAAVRVDAGVNSVVRIMLEFDKDI